ncbi:rab-GTPase-TBC domain-containing protein [Multifurca ochricompacta]|uniref:Rab-GTPase-TBC domain-containing protein n=1 Tax=Multifurca ochricompacta TaxID=376703 RepID=A0AAD4QR24_9AGAM|nr:rab-GTPase-TBC domain-containing protein [Multifurca ochricompacta]
MAARPPPTRPHINLNPSSHFSYPTNEWGEDDAWDSASDSESASNSQSAWGRSLQTTPSRPSGAASAPKPVPRRSQNSSSSTLAFSYTHVSAPSPGSYPSHTDLIPPTKNGWTIVQKTNGDGSLGVDDKTESHEVEPDHEGDNDMVFEDLESEFVDMPVLPKSRPNAACVRLDAVEIANDPLRLLRRPGGRHGRAGSSSSQRSRSSSPHYDKPSEKLKREQSFKNNRRHKFIECLSREDVDMSELRKLAWSGIPDDFRPLAWPLLLGYLPLPMRLRSSTLDRKRGEYQSLVDLTFAKGRDGLDQQIWHQIEIDVPRTRPGVELWMHSSTQRCLERILYVWAIRHPASGYVQGINDLATPFFEVFLSAYVDADPEDIDPSILPPPVLAAIEADSFWCLSRLLDGIQDNYITAQPGIQRSVKRMAELVGRIDAPLSEHLAAQGVEFMQFAFRWMNCLLMREISVKNTVRMWDTYLAEGPDAFSQFHLYVCSAFLVRWSDKLREMDFQGIIMFLQSLPTQDWTDHEIEMLLSQAFVLNSIWHNAQSHFTKK